MLPSECRGATETERFEINTLQFELPTSAVYMAPTAENDWKRQDTWAFDLGVGTDTWAFLRPAVLRRLRVLTTE